MKGLKMAARLFISIVSFFSALSVYSEVSFTGESGPPDSKMVLWYRKPATDWETEALPIGNGRLGAMFFGGVQNTIEACEILSIEADFRDTLQDRTN